MHTRMTRGEGQPQGSLGSGCCLVAGESIEAEDGGPCTASHRAVSRAQPHGGELFSGELWGWGGLFWGEAEDIYLKSPEPGSFSTPHKDRCHPMNPSSLQGR